MSPESGIQTYQNISQRAIASFVKLLREPQTGSCLEERDVQEELILDFHGFLKTLYSNLFTQPQIFGLPTSPDDFIGDDEPNEKEKKQQVKRKLDKPLKMILSGMDFLRLAGLHGTMDEHGLVLEDASGIIRQSGMKKNFLSGLEATGLVFSHLEELTRLTYPGFPAMMPALKALAASCSAYADEKQGRFMFLTSDFRALCGYTPRAMDLYCAFSGWEYEMVSDLHRYFEDRNFKTIIAIHAPHAWVVKYQGDRKVKNTPLFQIDYEERYRQPLRMFIKPASTQRLADLLPRQSQLLQGDFARRANVCLGDECGWCRNNKTLGPTAVEYNGEMRTLCWYTNPDIRTYDENTVELVKAYERMHAELLPAFSLS